MFSRLAKCQSSQTQKTLFRESLPVRVGICLLALAIMLAFVGGCSKESSPSGTGPIPDPPLEVVSSTPTGGASVAPSSSIAVTFNRAVDPSTVTATSFVVANATGIRTVNGSVVTFTPSTPFNQGVQYAVTLTTEIADTQGKSLASNYDFSFSVASLPTADAGATQVVTQGASVTLNGSGSNDPDGGTLTYAWTQVAGPSVGNLTGVQPSFAAPAEVTTVIFDLVVSNGVTASDPDRIVIVIAEEGSKAIFVSQNGNDANPGTLDLPKATIQAAMTAAQSTQSDLYVAAGVYSGSVVLADGVSMYGGFTADSWERDLAAVETIIQGGQYAITGANVNQLTIEGFTIRSANSASNAGSSVGISLHNSLGIVINQNALEIGNGANGSNGTDATDRTGNADGGNSGAAAYFALICSGAVGGAGGDVSYGRDGGLGGRSGGANGGSNGWDGENGGGNGGSKGGFAANGSPGSPGNPGDSGLSGNAGTSFGSISNGAYLAAHGLNGDNGGYGWGGGGGGGGGTGAACSGSGGGGGAGGLYGFGGARGFGGGGSIGIILSGGSEATITNNSITTGNGGNGGYSGKGGVGQNGGSGANGGTGNANGGAGGRGGNGGKGGNGGDGGCGGGGPVVGIVEAASSSTRTNNFFTLGVAGIGGARGDGRGKEGANGDRAEFKKID
ncbi:MAG: Ig-like domain-containing protein [bacterium]|nr:Ig-like domain-containing protein [bacterium]